MITASVKKGFINQKKIGFYFLVDKLTYLSISYEEILLNIDWVSSKQP